MQTVKTKLVYVSFDHIKKDYILHFKGLNAFVDEKKYEANKYLCGDGHIMQYGNEFEVTVNEAHTLQKLKFNDKEVF